MSNEKKDNVVEQNIQQEEKQEVRESNDTTKKDVIEVTIKRHIKMDDGALLSKVKLDFTDMTGAQIIKIDNELRTEGSSFDNLWNQAVLLKLASRASGINEYDLMRLAPGDFLEVSFQTRNFFLTW